MNLKIMNNKYLIYGLSALAGFLTFSVFFVLKAEAWYQPPQCEEPVVEEPVEEEPVEEEVVEEEETTEEFEEEDTAPVTTPPKTSSGGGGGMIWCSGPLAPGWDSNLLDGGCGGDYFIPSGSYGCPDSYPTGMGCVVPKVTITKVVTPKIQIPEKAWTYTPPKYYKG